MDIVFCGCLSGLLHYTQNLTMRVMNLTFYFFGVLFAALSTQIFWQYGWPSFLGSHIMDKLSEEIEFYFSYVNS